MATIQIALQTSSGQTQNQLLNIRRALAGISQEISENNRRAAQADPITRRSLQTKNQLLALERSVLRAENEANRVREAAARQEQRRIQEITRARQRAAREREQNARREAQELNRLAAARQAFASNLTFILTGVNQQLTQLTSNFVSSAASLQTFYQTVRVAEGDVDAASAAIDRLLALTVELVGIDTSDLIQFYGRLRAAGVEASRAETLIRGVTDAVAEQGKSTAVTRRILEQASQAVSAGRIVYEDFRSIIRELPTAFRVASDVVGENVRSIEEFREAAQRTIGESEAVIRFFERLAETSQGADLNTFNAQLEIFRDLLFVAAAEIGQELLPALTAALKQINSWIEAFRELNPAIKAIIGFTTAAAAGLTGLGVAVGGLTVAMGALNASLVALTGAAGLAGLAAIVTPLLPILGVGAGLAGVAVAAGYAINRLAELSDPANQALIEITVSATDAEMALEMVRAKAEETGNALQFVSQATAQAIQSAPGGIDVSAGTFEQLRAGALQEGSGGIVVVPEEAREAQRSVEELTEEMYNHIRAAADVREHIEELSEAQGALNDFWAVASGQVEDYSESINVVIPSIVNLSAETAALNAAIDANLGSINPATEAYESYGLALSSVAAEQELAAARGQLIDPVLRQQTLATREYAGAVSELGVRYEEVDDIAQRAIDASRDQIRSVSELTNEFQAAEPALDIFDESMQDIADSTDMATEAFDDFRANAIESIDGIYTALEPLIERLGDTGDEITSLAGAVVSALSGDIPGLIANVLDIIIPGLADPQRVLDFEQPVAGQPGEPLNLEDLQLDLDFGDALEGLEFDLPQELINLLEREGEPAVRQRPGPGFIYNATLGRYVPREEFFDETTGSGVGAPQPVPPPPAIGTSLTENVFQRAQFDLGGATDEADFEARRQSAVDAANAYYDLEDERIAGLMLSETELRDQREDNALARERDLRRISEATNRFAQERIRNEERAAEEATRLQERQARDAARLAEQLARDQARAQEEARRAADRSAEEQRERAERDAQLAVNLQENIAERAQFALTSATGEADFEQRRQASIDATNAFYDAELERINGLGLAENELRDLREDNALARDRDIQRITNATNTFAEERIRAEQRAAQEEQRLLEQTARERERAEAQALRDAERAARERERLAERAAREEARAAEEAARERLANERRIIDERRALEQNVVQRAQFALGGATDEADFEFRRQAAIRATEEFHDLELARINDTEASEERLQDLREDNALARERALRSLGDANNQFAQERIRDEERAAADALRVAEREATERLRLAERLESQIERLKDQQVDNEQARQDRIVAINEDAQRRLEQIEEDAQRRREDSELSLQRGFEDNIRELERERDAIEQRFRRGEITEAEARTQAEAVSTRVAQANAELGIRERRRQEDIAIRQGRAEEDLETRRRQGIEQAQIQAAATAVAIQEQLAPLFEEQQALNTMATETATIEATTATTAAETATMASMTAGIEATTAETASATALTESATAATQEATAPIFASAVDVFSDAATTFQQGASELVSADFGGIATGVNALSEGVEQIFELLRYSPRLDEGSLPNTLTGPPAPPILPSATGAVGGGATGVPTQPIVIENRNENTINLDGRQVAKNQDRHLVELDSAGRTVGSYRRGGA